jgi:Protein of unknown function (DUF3343)
MTAEEIFQVVLFKSVSHALKAEKILKGEGIPFKLIPVPKHISSDCGVCLRFMPDLKEKILQELSGRVEISEVRPLES